MGYTGEKRLGVTSLCHQIARTGVGGVEKSVKNVWEKLFNEARLILISLILRTKLVSG